MRCVGVIVASVLLSLAAGCASPRDADAPMAFTADEAPVDILNRPSPQTVQQFSGGFAGRTIRVSRVADIRLGPKEVVLTFDDGPVPGKTARILDTLDRFSVKATFLMVGQMARSYPGLVRQVAARGHSIGSHTQSHANLRAVGYSRAVEEIARGHRSVNEALGPSRRRSTFFRFPYLADTAALRAHLAGIGLVVLDVGIDSKDYFQSSPDQVRQRIMARLGSNGSGIILMHDIHGRTATMLPGLLADLRARGFKVVHLAPGGAGGMLIASAE